MTEYFYHQYKLAKDIPQYPKDWPLRWRGEAKCYYLAAKSTYGYNKNEPDIYADYNQKFYRSDVEDNLEWFTPVGDPSPWIPDFPNLNEIEHHCRLMPETNQTQSVDISRALNDLFESKNFYSNLHKFIESEYNQFHKLETGSVEDPQ